METRIEWHLGFARCSTETTGLRPYSQIIILHYFDHPPHNRIDVVDNLLV
jgi:hypothetical protein